MKRTYYYTDEINDDFSGTKITRRELPVDYKYFSDNPVKTVLGGFLYRIIAAPVLFLFQKIVYGERIRNKKVLKNYKKSGYFLYANHTRAAGDAFTPSLVTLPKKAYIIVNPDAVSIPVVKSVVEMLGAVPIPTDRHGMKNFRDAVHKHAEKNHCIVIYPEAHIWPCYTGIRPFKDVSFRYPAETGKPVFTFTTTYRKRKFFSRPGTTVYVDGPFFPDPALSVKENQRKLREQAYEAMKERSKLSSYEYAEYIKVSPDGRVSQGIKPAAPIFTPAPAPAAASSADFSPAALVPPEAALQSDTDEEIPAPAL